MFCARIATTFLHVLAAAAFSDNALAAIGDGETYIALLGRVPPLLPQLEHVSENCSLERHNRRRRSTAFIDYARGRVFND